MITDILRFTAIGAATVYLMSQVRKPSRWLGRFIVSDMNRRHSTLTDWGLNHIEIGKDFTVLDVGCGGGRTLNKLANLAVNGKIYGIDYAQGSLAASRAYNKDLVAAGQVLIEHASVSKLPFAADQFDLVTAIETQYYWPDLPGDMKEILRVLRPGGKVVIIAESYKGGKLEWLEGPLMRLLMMGASRLSPADQRELFTNAGYTSVQVVEDRAKRWICVIGQKPSPVQ
jgi:ubiquinone/menaquinone biosynthesis C-methylase UbiE